MVDIRLPSITGTTEKEQLLQIKSYLHQLVGQLQWALNDVGKSEVQVVPTVPATPSVQYVIPHAVAAMSEMDAQARFDEIKPLIIKSAEIVNAYYEEINKRLVSLYVAESDFGTFKQAMEQDIVANSNDVTQAFSNIQKIESRVGSVGQDIEAISDNIEKNVKPALDSLSDDVGNLGTGIKDLKDNVDSDLKDVKGAIDNINYSLVAVNANIKSGLLYYDENGIPVYGLEVGQRTMIDGVEVFNKFARFTSDRLSFYDQNDNEVAYISDRKLYINHVEIRGTFRMGGFVRTVLADGSIVKRWVVRGGEG